MSNYKCNKCFKCFHDSWMLKRHVESETACVISSNSELVISVTPNESLDTNRLEIPVLDPPKTYPCYHCNKVYKHRQSLNKHKKKCQQVLRSE